MTGGKIMNYREKKAKAREEAIRWQAEFQDHNYSYGEIVDWQAHFENLGKRYGLTREFKENGIL